MSYLSNTERIGVVIASFSPRSSYAKQSLVRGLGFQPHELHEPHEPHEPHELHEFHEPYEP